MVRLLEPAEVEELWHLVAKTHPGRWSTTSGASSALYRFKDCGLVLYREFMRAAKNGSLDYALGVQCFFCNDHSRAAHVFQEMVDAQEECTVWLDDGQRRYPYKSLKASFLDPHTGESTFCRSRQLLKCGFHKAFEKTELRDMVLKGRKEDAEKAVGVLVQAEPIQACVVTAVPESVDQAVNKVVDDVVAEVLQDAFSTPVRQDAAPPAEEPLEDPAEAPPEEAPSEEPPEEAPSEAPTEVAGRTETDSSTDSAAEQDDPEAPPVVPPVEEAPVEAPQQDEDPCAFLPVDAVEVVEVVPDNVQRFENVVVAFREFKARNKRKRQCEDGPHGFIFSSKVRLSGKTSGNADFYIFAGRTKLRSIPDLRSHMGLS